MASEQQAAFRLTQAAFRLTIGSDADLLLQKFIADLAEDVIASKVYEGGKYELANFLAGYVYGRFPADIREWVARDADKHRDLLARLEPEKNSG